MSGNKTQQTSKGMFMAGVGVYFNITSNGESITITLTNEDGVEQVPVCYADLESWIRFGTDIVEQNKGQN